MNQAMDAVRYAEPGAFRDTPKLASAMAKRTLLRHLADLASWSCDLEAHLQQRSKTACDHANCQWSCYQSEAETAAELSMSECAVKRTRRALVADGWISVSQEAIGRGAKSRYTIDRQKLADCIRSGKYLKGIKLHPLSLVPKGINVHPLTSSTATEGVQAAQERGAACSEKGCSLPSINKKNPLKPLKNPEASASASGVSVETKKQAARSKRIFTDAEVASVWALWPNRGGKREGLLAIREALTEREASGSPVPLVELTARVKTWLAWHARETAKGVFVPAIGYAQGWFGRKQRRYLDDTASPPPEPKVVIPSGEAVPLSATETDGWLTIRAVNE